MNIPTVDDPTTTLIYILIIIITASILTRIVAFLMNKMKRFKTDMTIVYLVRDIINYIIYFIALMIILQFFGINLTGTLLSLGIVGIAVILGKSIKVGDTLEIKGKKGIVERVTLRSTIIVDDIGVKDHIPNSTLTNEPYLQYKAPEKYRVDILTGLALDVDIEEFKDYITGKISEYDEILKEPKPDVYAKEISFKQSKVKVSFWVKDFNSKDKYKLIITNEIRKYVENGWKV